ncbi:hypothetical protein M3215_19365 [Bacillus cytotoxicus]|uniref:Uncharacterized protein n=1 Tax=Bacillus cytotoxicus TaxID=580165 RepID=A0ACC6AB55_9BACI|nr:hypothetical protein [Bacillus cytotoxicus]
MIAALNPIVSKQRVSAFLKGISAKGSFIGEFLPVMVNGQKGILQVKEGHPIKVICFELDSKQKNIRRIFIVSNPDKLNLNKDRLRAQCGLYIYVTNQSSVLSY